MLTFIKTSTYRFGDNMKCYILSCIITPYTFPNSNKEFDISKLRQIVVKNPLANCLALPTF